MPDTLSHEPVPNSQKNPKVFISYSWTSPGHQEQVRQWAERLFGDGVEVVLDFYDLKEGHDKFHFMERMVTDPEITHVLVICDKSYAEKADSKKAGVGAESQIISGEVYAKTQQSKFIPLACEFSEEREPFLPVFLKSRIWLNFSSPEAVNQNWEKLIRLLYGKPAYEKPAVGKVPAYIASNVSTAVSPIGGKLATFKHAFLTNTKGLNSYRQDFLSACIGYADSLRVRKDPHLDGISFAAKILEDCATLKEVRDYLVDWVLLEGGEISSNGFQESLLGLLEELIELKARPVEVNSWSESWFEAQSFFVYETFLYIVAALLQTGSFATLHEVFSSNYLKPKSMRHDENNFDDFGALYGHAEILQLVLAPERQRLNSAAAELIKRQANRPDLPFASIIEAELLVLLLALISPEASWFPQTMYYMSHATFPFFVRATQHRYFAKLATITGVSDADALRIAARAGYERLGVKKWPNFYMMPRSFWEYMNLDKLNSLK